MFFLLRSAFCIALVVSCLPKVNDYSTSLTAASTVGAAEQWISASLGRACTSAPAQCAGLMAQSVLPVVRKASRNTLVASDLEPAWTGPAGKTTN
jgi:hypothetical protein